MPSADAKDNKKSLDSARPPRRFSNNVAADDAVNFKQIGTQFDGGSLLDLDQDFFRTSCNLVGHVFRIKTKEGKMFEGIFETFNPNFDVALSLVHEIAEGFEDALPHDGAVKEKVIFSRECIVTMTTITEAETFSNKKGFATDQEISRTLNGESNKKVLEVWEPDSHPDEDDEHFFDAEHTKDGWAVEDMFEKNKTFGVVSTYEADLSQFSNVQVDFDETSPEYRLKAAEAERLAQQIQANPASQKASLLENDDQERDIVVNVNVGSSQKNAGGFTSSSDVGNPSSNVGGGGSGRPSMTFKPTRISATTTTTTLGDGVTPTEKYVPPNKRNNMAGGGNKRFVKPSGPFSRQPTSTSASNASPRVSETSTPVPYSNKVAGGATSPRFAAQQPTQTQPQSPAANAGVYASTATAAATSHDRSPVQSNIHNDRRSGAPGNQVYTNNNANMDNNKRDMVNNATHYTTYSNAKQYGQQQTSGNDQQRKQFIPKGHQKDKQQNLADLRKFSNEFHLVDAQQTRMTSPPGANHRQSPPYYQRSPPKNQSPLTPKGSQGHHFSGGKNHQTSSSAGGKNYAAGGNVNVQSSTSNLPPRHQQQQQQQQQNFPSSSRPTNLTTSTTSNVNQIDETSTKNANVASQQFPSHAAKRGVVVGVDQSTATSTSSSSNNSSPTATAGGPVYSNDTPTADDANYDEMTDSTILKSKLNPDAKEFCPTMQFYRPTPVQTPVGAAVNFYAASGLQSPVGQPMPAQFVANYAAAAAAAMMTSAPPPPTAAQPPTPQQSTSPQLSQTPQPQLQPMPQTVIYAAGAAATQFQQPPPTGAAGGAAPPPAISTFSTMALLPGGTPIYTINQPAVAYLHSNGGAQAAAAAAAAAAYRPMKAAGQPTGAIAATGQPLMTAPSLAAANASYFVQYPAPGAAAGGPPQGAAHQIYPQTQYVISTAPRMQMQYHIVPQMTAGPPTDNNQNQQIFVAQQQTAALQQQQQHHAGNNGNGQTAVIASQSQQQMVASPYVFQYAAGGHPAALAYPSGQVVYSAPRMQYAVLPQAAGGDVYVTSYPHAAAAAAYPHLMRSASLTGNGAIYAGQQQQPQQICQQQQSTNGNNGTPANA